MENDIINNVITKYKSTFTGDFVITRSPGRINIIGEHTDYNEGFVLPAAIDKAAFVAAGKREDNAINLFSKNFNEGFETSTDTLKPIDKSWTNYITGVANEMIKRGHKLQGFNLVIDGTVPLGAGLSSSASVECATAFALNELFQLHIPLLELALIAQKAEHTFAGVMCGIMDQFASIFGKKDHAIQLDCKTLEYKYEPLILKDIKIVLLNTNVKHSLASGEYNIRRQQCSKGVELIKKSYPEVNSLRDATQQMLERCVKPVDKLIYKRCKYVLDENQRLLDGCIDLKNGNLKALGEKMYASHYGLSHEYEVSCKELDFLVEYVKDKPAVLGARMMGGGFGGCTINLIKENAADKLIDELTNAYQISMGKELTSYIATIEDGASCISPG